MNRIIFPLLAAALALPAAASAAAPVGEDAAACAAGKGPAVLVKVSGLRDRTGRMKLELYPANEDDWLEHRTVLQAAGKTFRRVWADVPANGAVAMCIKVPKPGRYGLVFTHDRDGKNKFNFRQDGAGVPSNRKLGRAKPKLADGVIDVGAGVKTINITVQYLHGILSGFRPD
ncbi:DUF2141 domain-containing protein [Hephaestia sp. GCM10023244]|uniref:DUF2141 domain-containing protein n=1 Tax=unclassified Hephaestia TaxID=2631281 RepID=UPI002077352E|nr:DUF2141 domain-containing protein [Hephaestia sp. MAHUQ-44]MCM8730499.1 DUF2141 domain-containing protein [Hephaestia sp. MAHUQ-44]